MKLKSPATADYTAFVAELKSRITSARVSAARAVTGHLILLYWDIGRGIVEKQETLGWGESVVEMLARDLRKAFPEMRGFSPDNLWRMRQFYTEYVKPAFLEQAVPEMKEPRGKFLGQAVPEIAGYTNAADRGQILAQVVRELVASVPWGHHLALLRKAEAPAARLYYLKATAQYGWTRNVLLNQIKAGAYERATTEKKMHNFELALPEHLAEQADEALKSSYNLEFPGIRRVVKERELEDLLIDRLRDFILELGYGFCFVGRQHRLTLGRKEYFIDLLFYHRFLKSLVAFELKVGPFEPEFAGKMDFYLNLLNEKSGGPMTAPPSASSSARRRTTWKLSSRSRQRPIPSASRNISSCQNCRRRSKESSPRPNN